MTPILAKELGVGSRLLRTYVFRAFYGVVLGLALWSHIGLDGGSLPRMTTSQVASLGHNLFATFVFVQFFGVTLFSLLAGADFVVKELRGDTLGLLVLTPLSGRQIVTGKWMAAVAQSAYLMFCGLPVLAACVYLGAVGFVDFVVVVLSTLSSSILAAALSVWTASGGRNPYGAGILAALAYLALFCFAGVLNVLIPGIMGLLHPLGYLICGSPATEPAGAPNAGFATIIPVSLGLAWLILGRAGEVILSPATLAPRSVRTSKEIVDRQAYIEQAARNLGTRVRDGGVWDRNPLLWKDLRTRAAAQLAYEIRLGIGVFLGLLFLGSLVVEADIQVGFFHLMFGLSIFLAVCAGSGLFFRDRDAGRIDTLRVLPVGILEIVQAKLLSGPASPEGTVVLLLQVLSLNVFFRQWGARVGFQAAAAVFVFLLFVYLLGALASLLLHKTRLAILASGSLVLGLLIWSGFGPANPYSFLERSPRDIGVFSGLYLGASGLLALVLTLAFRRKFAG